MGALYGELSEEEHAAWEHLKQQKPSIADEYTRLKQTTAFLFNNEQIGEQLDEQQNDTAFFDRQWQTLHAMMNEEERATAAPVPISLPSTVPPQAKRSLLFTLPQMQRWYDIAAMLVVAVGLGISVYRWQNTISSEGSITRERREQEVTGQEAQEQGMKLSPASPSTNEQKQTFGTTAKPSPSPSRPNTLKGASEKATPKNSAEQPANADVPAQQPKDAVKSETAQQEEFKKDVEASAKERPAERKQAAPASEIAQPTSTQPAQAEGEQTKRKSSNDEARSTSPAPQAAPILDALKSLAMPQGGSGSSSGARQRLENNLQQAVPKRAAPALPSGQATPHRAITSTQPTIRVDSTRFRIKTQDSTRNNK